GGILSLYRRKTCSDGKAEFLSLYSRQIGNGKNSALAAAINKKSFAWLTASENIAKATKQPKKPIGIVQSKCSLLLREKSIDSHTE
ncbi:TPA: hypothetical protein ACLBFU_001423, partial [Neisseria meningitidis]